MLFVQSVFLCFRIWLLFMKNILLTEETLKKIQLEFSKVLAQQSPTAFVCQNIRYCRNPRSRSEIQASKHVSKVRQKIHQAMPRKKKKTASG